VSIDKTDRTAGVCMTGYRTTFTDMFAEKGKDIPHVHRIAIPLIQRDYARTPGRQDERDPRHLP
jgi:hypothetical protein